MAINEKWVEKVRKELAELAKGSGKNTLYEADMVIETLLQENARIKKEYANYMEKVARSEISAKEWRNRVTTKLMKTDPNIEKDDLFFSATTSGYSLAYRPYHPEESSADFKVYGSFNGGIQLHGISLIPNIITYGSIEEFENN